jgi:hypothetical protein
LLAHLGAIPGKLTLGLQEQRSVPLHAIEPPYRGHLTGRVDGIERILKRGELITQPSDSARVGMGHLRHRGPLAPGKLGPHLGNGRVDP